MVIELKLIFVREIPKEKEEGILYVSREFHTAVHLCICGCKGPVVTPFSHVIDGKDHGWNFTFHNEETVTLRPSIGNWSPGPYHAHYYITKNKIELCEPIRPVPPLS